MHKMTKRIFFYLLISFVAFSVTSCDDDDPEIPVEPELITTLTYTLTPSDGGDAVIMSFQDLDGDGGNAPTIIGGTLAANQSYSGRLVLLNELESPAEDISDEIGTEAADEHQFFFESTINDLTVAYNDTDGDGNPVGLQSTLTTGAATTGTMTIILRHLPNKSASNVSAGDITNAGGETDIEVTFPIDVQ